MPKWCLDALCLMNACAIACFLCNYSFFLHDSCPTRNAVIFPGMNLTHFPQLHYVCLMSPGMSHEMTHLPGNFTLRLPRDHALSVSVSGLYLKPIVFPPSSAFHSLSLFIEQFYFITANIFNAESSVTGKGFVGFN
jgi:hypothetical protein